MGSNDIVLLRDMLERDRQGATGTLEGADFDTYFAARHLLHEHEPSHDDLTAGLVDGRQDGGIDAVYVFVSGMCVRDDADISKFGKEAKVELHIMQVKNTAGFKEDAIDKLVVNLPKLLDFGRDETVLARWFNAHVLETTGRFLRLFRTLDMPKLSIHATFASLRAEHLHPATVDKAEHLEAAMRAAFGGCEPHVNFVDAAALADKARQRRVTMRSLALAENPISTNMAGGYVAVVNLNEYERFITRDSGELDATLFEANVRDYEGGSPVNRSIESTLEHEDPDVDFWWLNNGVTIVADEVQPANKLLKLKSPQIVNGLQTSHEIYKRARINPATGESRSLLVKVIEARNDQVRDRIIQATNSQTSFGPSALKATDKIQRQIEEYLLAQGLYYERRRRYYQNQQAPLNRLVSIDEMGQAVLSITIQCPHIARSSITSIFESERYNLLFAHSHSVHMFHACIGLLRACREYLIESKYTKPQSDDFVYHLAMTVASMMTRKNSPTAADVASLENVNPPVALLLEGLRMVREVYGKVNRRTHDWTLDRLAKDEQVTADLRARIAHYLRTSSRSPS